LWLSTRSPTRALVPRDHGERLHGARRTRSRLGPGPASRREPPRTLPSAGTLGTGSGAGRCEMELRRAHRYLLERTRARAPRLWSRRALLALGPPLRLVGPCLARSHSPARRPQTQRRGTTAGGRL